MKCEIREAEVSVTEYVAFWVKNNTGFNFIRLIKLKSRDETSMIAVEREPRWTDCRRPTERDRTVGVGARCPFKDPTAV